MRGVGRQGGLPVIDTMRAALLSIVSAFAIWAFPAQAADLIAPVQDRAFMERLLQQTAPEVVPPSGLTGISLPHHVLAADLIAKGFWAASEGSYDRIILLAPDHLGHVKGAFAIATQPQQTVFGAVTADAQMAETLLANPMFAPHPDPQSEHASAVLLPFIARFFPKVPVLSVYAATRATPQDWESAFALLAPHVTPRTLIVQSTDYAHFLPIAEAVLRDQETLTVITSGRADLVADLIQPDHLDAPAAQYLQMRLQAEVFDSAPAVLANRNSLEYGGAAQNTTSYILTLYHRDPVQLSGFDAPEHQRFFIGGDVLLGRYLTPLLQDGAGLGTMMQRIMDATNGAALIANLEGVLFADPLINAPATAHVMHAGLAAPILRSLNVRALSLANNHALDFGPDGYDSTVAALRSVGLGVLPHQQIVDIGPARVAAINMIEGGDPFAAAEDPFDWICKSTAAPPVIAFLHWGVEHTRDPRAAERQVAARLAACGVSALVGAHSHQSSTRIERALGRMPWVFSLGNLLFDQEGARADGALVEVRVFTQGTVALRLVPLGNLFDVGVAARAAQ